ncbi:MAG: L-2-hydroxyglutarate oxidase, partial [Acidimicrobiaceae bacterium]
ADVVVVGGGIVGLATAYAVLKKNPKTEIVVLEKESQVGAHQTRHNSGVIHSGLYYKPGSLKAKNCLNGYAKLLQFCDENNIAHEICGKVVVATSQAEFAQLEMLYQRGLANGLTGIRKLNSSEIQEIEPFCSGVAGFFVPQTGIVDYGQMVDVLEQKVLGLGAEVLMNQQVVQIDEQSDVVVAQTQSCMVFAKKLVSCAGLQSDRVANQTESAHDLRILPFRGEYFELEPSAKHLVRNLIYPVPDPNFPFLGVHFTRRIDGTIECGPNAVLAFAREGYRKTDFSLRDFSQTLSWPGFRKIARKYWRTGLGEYHRSMSKAAFVRALQKLVPEIEEKHLKPAGSGVRAQACSRDGLLLDDFEIRTSGRVTHVCNARSPSSKSSLAIGEAIARHIDVTI